MQLFLATALCLSLFAFNSILCRAALAFFGMEPLQYTAIRSISAAVMLAVLCAVHAVRALPDRGSVWKQAWKESSWSGSLFLFLYMISFSLAYVNIGSAAGTLFINTAIQFGMVGWGLVHGVRLTRMQGLGLALAFAGLLALLSPGLTAPPFFSSMLMIISGLAWAGYTICGRGASSASLAAAGNFFRCSVAGVLTAILALMLEGAASPAAWGCALVSGAIISGPAYLLWYVVVPRYSLTSASVIQLSVPLITAVQAMLILDEPVTLRLALCSVPILGGICLALVSRKPQQEKR
ncbi:DMT family transporter [uncultured Mailhella sp.]|uniref:DMT family transporter n=1 Tax=uncultured Mailhella sp. TaxID=1981031 RepID=UPI0026343052|nr:DMT family transporter [uncultured Mailhella sp.]